MGGIVGEIAFNGKRADLGAVDLMSEALTQTPFGYGSCSWGWVALGHKRQRVDPAGRPAPQPLADDRLGLGVVLTGRFQNHDELHIELAGNYQFRQASAPEIVLAAYHRWGEGFVERLEGVFTLAVVDALREKVLLARDSAGTVPLYLSRALDVLRFATDAQCLRAGGGLPATEELVTVPAGSVHVFEPTGRTGVRTFTQASPDRAGA
jgi:asparagine synthase (glutamine-hydrolysing)